MNFTVSKTELSNALQNVSHAISSNSPQPSLRGIKIDAYNDMLQMTGSDADVSIFYTMKKDEKNNLNIVEEGSILVESRYLNEIVKKIDADTIHVEIIDGALTRFSGSLAQFKINGMRPDDYPAIDFTKPASSIKINAADLNLIIDQTVFATSAKETRPVLTGVNIKMADHNLVFTATDSYRLAKKTIPFDSEETFNVTIPAKSLNEVRTTMLGNDKEEIEIAVSDKKAQFISDNMILQTRLLDGSYPETDRLIPKEFSYALRINRYDLIRAIDRTSFIKNENMTINRLQLSADEVIITNKNQEIGESQESLAAVFEGEPLDISFAGNYVMDAAKALKGENILISFTGDMKPFILSNPDDDSVIQLVLPVRTYN